MFHRSKADGRSPRQCLLEVHAAMTLKSYWTATCALLRETLPLHDLILAVSLDGGHPSISFSTCEVHSPEQWKAAYEASGLRQTEAAAPGRLVLRMTDWMPQEMKDSAEAALPANHLAKAQVFYAAALAFWRGKKFAHLLSIMRRSEQGDFTDQEMRRLEALHADLETALRRVLKSEQQHADLTALGRTLRDVRLPLLVLGWNLRPIFGNAEAAEAGRHWNGSATPAAELKRRARPALPPRLAEACRALRTELTSDGHHNLELTRLPLTRRVRLAEAGASAAEVVYTKPRAVPVDEGRFIVRFAACSAGASPTLPATLDRLTVSEHAVAELVGVGKSNDEVSAALGVSVHTVRSHLRTIFRKLGLHSRTALAAHSHRNDG